MTFEVSGMAPVAHSYICFVQGAWSFGGVAVALLCSRVLLTTPVTVETSDGKIASLLRQHVVSYVDCATATWDQAQEIMDKSNRALSKLSE